MLVLSLVFILISPIFASWLSSDKKKLNIKKIVKNAAIIFGAITVFINIMILQFGGISNYQFNADFLVKYAILSLITSIIVAFIPKFVKKHIIVEKRKEKKKSKIYKTLIISSILLYLLFAIFIILNIKLNKINRNIYSFKLFFLNLKNISNEYYWILLFQWILGITAFSTIFLTKSFSKYEVKFKTKRKHYDIEKGIVKIARILPVILFLALSLALGINTFLYKQTVEDQVIVLEEPNKAINFKIHTLGLMLPNKKSEGKLPVIISIQSKSKIATVFGQIAVQGTGSERYPKKNWSLYFYEDFEMTKPLKLKIGDSIASNKWVAKAEWIDVTLLRDPLSYNLWGEIVESRDEEPKNEIQKALKEDEINEEARGYPLTHPIRIDIDGQFYGVSILTLSHDPNNYNVNKENDKHLYFEFDARYNEENVGSWKSFTSRLIGSCLDFNVPDEEDVCDLAKEQIDLVGELINSPLADFKKNFDKYLDRSNIIDMFLFYEMIFDHDAMSYDTIVVTYDLDKWFFLPWDKDSTFGMRFDDGLYENSENRILFDAVKEERNQILWHKTYNAFKSEIENRYKDLRDKGVFTVDNIDKQIDIIYSKIPKFLLKREEIKWSGRASIGQTDRYQIIDWFGKKLQTLDEYFNYKK